MTMSTDTPDTAGPTAAPPPLRRDAERNRQRLLAAARELFMERGLDVTLDDIAARAGVGVGTAYRRFANKEVLIDALMEERIDALVAAAKAAQELPDPWDGLVAYLTGSLEMQANDRGLKQVLYAMRPGSSRVDQARSKIAPEVIKLVGNAQAAGRLRPDVHPTDVPMISVMLGTVVDFTRDIEPGAWRRYLQIVLDGLGAEPAAPTPLPHDGVPLDRFPEAMARWHTKR